MLGFGPSKTTDIRRLTKKQLSHVFHVPKKKDPLKEGLFNEKGAAILKDVIRRERRSKTRTPLSDNEKERRIKLREQKEKKRKRDLWEDMWGVISNVDINKSQKETSGGSVGLIGFAPIGTTTIP